MATTQTKTNKKVASVESNHLRVLRVVKAPRITEKATHVAEQNVYTFNVDASATKKQVKESIVKIYKVTPVRINIVNIKQRNVTVRGKKGKQKGGRKAYVFLKKGDKIEFV